MANPRYRTGEELSVSPKTPGQMAYEASGSEEHLLKLLRKAGAKIIRTRPAYVRDRDLLQLHVRFKDGTIGYFFTWRPYSDLDVCVA